MHIGAGGISVGRRDWAGDEPGKYEGTYRSVRTFRVWNGGPPIQSNPNAATIAVELEGVSVAVDGRTAVIEETIAASDFGW